MLGENLIFLRKKLKLTQEDVADQLNVKRQTYSAYERNVSTPDAYTLKKIADYFSKALGRKVITDDLIGPTNENSPGSEPELDGLDGIDFAFMGDYKDLTEQDKETVRMIAKRMKERDQK